MAVVTVTEATQLRDAGQLNGRDVAVGGWFVEEFPPCAAVLGVYTSALEDCEIASFADTQDAAEVCKNNNCHLGHTDMAPWFMNDTLLGINDYGGASDVKPIPVVVIAHSNDPRAWQCTPANLARCQEDLVADQLAWPLGNGFQESVNTFDCTDFKKLAPRMDLSELSTTLGQPDQLVSAAATTAGCVSVLDPRWNKTGTEVVWVVRSVPSTFADAEDPTRPVTVSVIDDASGNVIDSQPLATAGGYSPARLWITETRHNVDPNDDSSTGAFLRITQQAATVAEDAGLGSVHGNRESLTNGPDSPLLLTPGNYTLDAWLAPIHDRSSEATGPPIAECSTDLTLTAGDDILLDASYAGHHDCTWSNAAQPSFGFP